MRSLPATRVPATPYRRAMPRPGALRLDGNEGSRPSLALVERLSREGVELLRDYPDLSELESAIAEQLEVDAASVVVTAGADDALDRACRAYLEPGRQIILPIPTFEMLYRFVEIAGGKPVTVAWSERFPTDRVIAALNPRVSLVAMISPNNPTGQVADEEDLRRVAVAAESAIVLLDHVYVEYADEDLTLAALELGNVVTLRTFSKAWGLAGCRVGYAVGPPEVVSVIRSAGNPYPVSNLSISVAATQLSNGRQALAAHVARVREERSRLFEKLTDLGAAVRPSQGNFLFADFGQRCRFVYDALAFAGVMVRFFPHRPEIATGLRITLPDSQQGFQTLVRALELCLAPEALVFDLDGVLADVEESYRRCILETAGSFGVELSRRDLEEAVHAGDANSDWQLLQRILQERGVSVSLETVTDAYQRRYLGAEGTSGLRERERALVSREWLERLARDYRLAIVTGRPREEAIWFLQRHGLMNLFDSVVCHEDGPRKPSPEPVQLALAELGVSRAWMIGDTPDDIVAAGGAGVVPIGVVAPGDDRERSTASLRRAGAVAVLPRVTALEELLP